MNLSEKLEQHIFDSLNETNKKKLLEIETFRDKINNKFPNMSFELYSKELERKFGFVKKGNVLDLTMEDNFNLDLVYNFNGKNNFLDTNLIKIINNNYNKEFRFTITSCKNDFYFILCGKNTIEEDLEIYFDFSSNNILVPTDNSDSEIIQKKHLEFYLDNAFQKSFKELFNLNFDFDFESNLILKFLDQTLDKNNINITKKNVFN